MLKDLTVTLEDQPGQLASFGEALGNAGVNIEGICAVTAEGRGTIHLLVEDVSAARGALESAGIKVEGEIDVVIIEMSGEDRPGTLGRTARKLADAGVNITFAYMATRTRGVLGVSDRDKAIAAL